MTYKLTAVWTENGNEERNSITSDGSETFAEFWARVQGDLVTGTPDVGTDVDITSEVV